MKANLIIMVFLMAANILCKVLKYVKLNVNDNFMINLYKEVADSFA